VRVRERLACDFVGDEAGKDGVEFDRPDILRPALQIPFRDRGVGVIFPIETFRPDVQIRVTVDNPGVREDEDPICLGDGRGAVLKAVDLYLHSTGEGR